MDSLAESTYPTGGLAPRWDFNNNFTDMNQTVTGPRLLVGTQYCGQFTVLSQQDSCVLDHTTDWKQRGRC